MRYVGIDIETAWSASETGAARLVCVTLAERVLCGAWLDAPGGYRSEIYHAVFDVEALFERLMSLLEDPDVTLVGMAFHLDLMSLLAWAEEQSGGHDLPGRDGRVRLLGAVVRAVQERRLADVFWREWLLWVLDPDQVAVWQRGTKWAYVSPNTEDRRGAGDSKRPGMSLEAICARWSGVSLGDSKTGGVRTQYASVLAVPCSGWPQAFLDYARKDPALHLVAFYSQSRGVDLELVQSYWAGGVNVEGRLTRAMAPDGAMRQGYVFRGEEKIIRDALAFGALQTGGGLYVDRAYAEGLAVRYLDFAEQMTPHDPTVAREHLAQLPLFADEPRTMQAALSDAKQAKTIRKNLVRSVAKIYDRMPTTWKPPLTPKGREAQANEGAAEGPWSTWSDAERTHLASLSCKVIAEALRDQVDPDTSPGALAWLLSRDSPHHPLSKIASGRYTLDDLATDWRSMSVQGELAGLWAHVVRDMCYRQVNTGLWPLLQVPEGQSIHPSRCKRLITGRWSAEGGLRQNLSRTGGTREACVPARGWKIIAVDYSTIELFPVATVLARAMVEAGRAGAGYVSSLGTVLKTGRDPHVMLAIELAQGSETLKALRALAGEEADRLRLHDIARAEIQAGTPLGKAFAALRQTAKAPNYGFPGMMSAETFLENQRRQGDLTWSLRTAVLARRAFFSQWHEMEVFQEWLQKHVLGRCYGKYLHFGWLIRGCGKSLTIAANQTFQTPVALMASDALFRVWLETQGLGTDTHLRGAVLSLFAHDENVLTAPAERAEAVLSRVVEIMETTAQEYFPGFPVKAKGTILDRFGKA